MEDKKKVLLVVRDEWLRALDAAWQSDGQPNRSAAIIAAVNKIYGIEEAATAPNGVRKDVLPTGWRSRLYRDRYMIVADWQPGSREWQFSHYHEWDGEHTRLAAENSFRADEILPGDGRAVEVWVIAPDHMLLHRGALARDIRLALSEWITTNE